MKQGNILNISFLVLLFLGCEEQFVPEGLYGYQVENLLSDNGTSEWVSITRESDCGSFPVKLEFALASDSLLVNELTPTCDINLYDTTFIGRASASEDNLIFTDSLIFEDNSFWIIKKLRSDHIEIEISGTINRYNR